MEAGDASYTHDSAIGLLSCDCTKEADCINLRFSRGELTTDRYLIVDRRLRPSVR